MHLLRRSMLLLAVLTPNFVLAQPSHPPAAAVEGASSDTVAIIAPATQEQVPTTPSIDATFGKGATLRSADDRFSLNIRGRVQVRATVSDAANDGSDPMTEMVVRRMRIVFQGNAMGPELTYYVQLAFSNLDTEPDLRLPLRDAYVTWAPLRDLNVRFGQMKVQYGRQRVVSSSALQMVDRSVVTGELNVDRDVGFTLFSKDLFGLGGHVGYNLGIFGGDGRNRLGRRAGYLTTARIELSPFGSFDDFVESDVKRDSAPRLAFGLSAAYNQNTNRPRSTIGDPYAVGDFDYLHLGADFLFKLAGLSLQGELMVRKANTHAQTLVDDGEPVTIHARSAWGAYVQSGVMLTDKLELTARYGYLKPLSGNTDARLVQTHELGGGLSYYVQEHNLKLQADYFYVPTDGFNDGTHQARVQTQLFF